MSEGWRWLRLVITGTRYPGVESCVQLSVVKFYNNALRISAVSVKNPGGTSPRGEEPFNLLNDSVYRKWLDFNFTRAMKSELIFEFQATVHVTHYELYTANDFPGRDPISWSLHGSNNYRHWELLDQRIGFEAPAGRYTLYSKFALNQGKQSETEIAYKKARQLARVSSMEIIDTCLSGFHPVYGKEKVCSEYQNAKNAVVVKWHFMETSKFQRCLQVLDQMMRSRPIYTSFSATLLLAIKKAYSLHNDAQAQRQSCTFSGLNLMRSIYSLYSSLNWRSDYFHLLLRELVETEDSSALIGCLSLLAKAGEECQARKLMAFHTILQRIALPPASSENKTTNATGQNEQVRNAMAVVAEFIQEFIDNLKLKVFHSVFLEPSKYYFHCIGDFTMRDDVEVHGSNTYLAVLLATLGIRLPLVPFLHDDGGLKGCCNFLAVKELKYAFDALMDPINLGKAWEGVPVCKNRTTRIYSYVPKLKFIFDASCAAEIACFANCDDSSLKQQRQELAFYLEAFTRFFRKEYFLERAFLSLIGDNGIPKQLDIVFEEMKTISATGKKFHIDPDITDVKEWIYDVENNYAFHIDRAYELFRFLDIVPERN